MISSGSSRPTARRIRRSEKPSASISSFVHMECVMEAGCWISVSQSPRLTASAHRCTWLSTFFGFLKAAHLEGDNTAEPRHLADSHGVMRMKQFELNRDGGKRLYQQIYAQLRSQIFSGEIAAGQPPPSYRFMSRKYQVNVATVEKAYDLLEANGYIRRCQGSGSYVLPLDNFEFFANGVVLDSFQAGQSEDGPVYDFATSTPLATQEETRQFVALADELVQQRPGVLLRYPPMRGPPALTQALRQHLAACGIAAVDEDILVVKAASRASTSSARRLSARTRSCSHRAPAIRSRCIVSSAPVRGW